MQTRRRQSEREKEAALNVCKIASKTNGVEVFALRQEEEESSRNKACASSKVPSVYSKFH